MTEPPDADLKIDGPVASQFIQANVINAGSITITGPAAQVLEQLQQAQQQLILSRSAEQRTGLLVSILQVALVRAFEVIGRLTAERDARLPEAKQTHSRTQVQLDRAEADHQRATTLVIAIGRRIGALQQQLLAEQPAAAAGFQAASDLPTLLTSPDDILADLSIGLDRIEQLLTVEEETLATIANDPGPSGISGHTEPDPFVVPATTDSDKAARVAKLKAIVLDVSIGYSHRERALNELRALGRQKYRQDIAAGLRLIITDDSLDEIDRQSAVTKLGKLAPEFRLEAVGLLKLRMRNHEDLQQRVFACEELAEFDPDNREYYITFLRQVTAGDEDLMTRYSAARRWYGLAPGERTAVLSELHQIIGQPPYRQDIGIRRIRELIQEIETDPYYVDKP